jgi:CheY-like chemotaxis protein
VDESVLRRSVVTMSPAKLRCVVVDDDREFLEQVRRWFWISCTDFEVCPFANSVEALDYLRRERVDLIVTAYLVPAIDGLQLISIVRAFNAHVPICMTSRVPIQDAALARGATAFVSKARLWSQLGSLLRKLREREALAA